MQLIVSPLKGNAKMIFSFVSLERRFSHNGDRVFFSVPVAVTAGFYVVVLSEDVFMNNM